MTKKELIKKLQLQEDDEEIFVSIIDEADDGTHEPALLSIDYVTEGMINVTF